MKRSKKIIVSIALIVLTTFTLTNFTLASGALNPEDYNPHPSVKQGGIFLERVGKALGAIKVIGIIVEVGMLMVIGIKYIIGGVEQKAEYKKTIIPYLIGAVMLGAIISIISIIEAIAL